MANEKRWLNGWISDALYLNQSPFFKESHHYKYKHGEAREKVSFYISKSAYNDLMNYFKGNGLTLTDGMNNILNDKLEMINTSKRTVFNDIELIMIIPKTRNLAELNDKSFILTLYNVKTDFENGFIYDKGFNKSFNFNFELEDFSFFPELMDIFNNMKRDVNFNIINHNPYGSGEFKEYHQRLEDFHELDLSKCYFVRFPLNNYLDINREGQYQSSRWRGWHEGLYIFDDFNRHRLYFQMRWRYDLSGMVRFRGEFLPMIEFMHDVKNADMKNVRDCHESLLNNNHDREFMEASLKDAEEMKEWIEHQIDFYKRNLGK